MSLALVIGGVALSAASGFAAAALRRRPALAQRAACAVLCAGALLGLSGAVGGLAAGGGGTLRAAWAVPGGALALRLDALAAFFLVPIFLVPALGSIYGLAYWPQERLGGKATRLQIFHGLVTAAMALLVVADNAVLFLAAWEVMALSGFLLVLTEHEKPEAQRAAFIYLASTRVGTLALLALFALLAQAAGSFDFDRMEGLAAGGPWGAAVFSLALLGFGLKAGLVPLHFWLPPAHAAAPSHVSALMSGVLIKTGIYGLLRVTSFFDAPPMWWGASLAALGVASGVLGVAFALAQHDLKRLLAYHSVENIGIIAMGAGLALLGRARGDQALVLLGLAGAVLHVVNHATFKSLLFLGAGAVQHAAGTRDLERLGGLAKGMRATSLLFLVGAAAISGLPPLNGFASEWLVARGALRSLAGGAGDPVAFAVLVAPSLALVGGLAAACFVKVQGSVFLGTPRTAEAARAHEAPRAMLVPMGVLAAACAAVGLFPGALVGPLARAAAAWSRLDPAALAEPIREATASAALVGRVGLVLLLVAAAAIALRRARLRAGAPRAETWGCGFAAPTARMQYTASSFAGMLVERFRAPLALHLELVPPAGLFPRRGAFRSHAPDPVLDLGLTPALRATARAAAALRQLASGRIQFQAFLVLLTLVVVLGWSLVLR